MKALFGHRNSIVLIFGIMMLIYGVQGMSYAQEANPTLTASTPQPLSEKSLHESVVTLVLSEGRFADKRDIGRALTISGIEGVTFDAWYLERVSNTKATVELIFVGNFDTDSSLTFTVEAGAIADYDGDELTAQLPVTAVVDESLVASTVFPLTEANLNGSIITLTLTGRRFADGWDIQKAVTLSGIEGATITSRFYRGDYDRVSDTKVIVRLAFNGDFDTDATLTLTVGADAIGYNKDFTFNFPVTAVVDESLTATTDAPLTEATLDGSIITLTLTGRRFASSWAIEDALTFSGIEGATVRESYLGVSRISDTEATVKLAFSGNLDTDGILTLTVGADAIGYNKDFTFNFPVTAVEESLDASTKFPLTEANLNGSIITLTLTGRQFADRRWDSDIRDYWDIRDALTLSGIEGATVTQGSVWDDGVERVSDTEVTVELAFSGDFDTDGTLTLTVGADAVNYNKDFTFNFPVTATEQSDATVSISPSSIVLPGIGEKLTLNLDIANGENVAGYQATVSFDPSVLNYVESANGDYLPAEAFFVKPILDYDWLGAPFSDDLIFIRHVTVAGNTLAETRNGDGTLATLTFEVAGHRPSEVTLSNVHLVDADGKRWEVTTKNGEMIEPPDKNGEVIEPPELVERIFGDINLDGVVNIQDLVIVSKRFGWRGQSIADVSGDGLVNIVDLVLVAAAFADGAAAPSLHSDALEMFTAADVQQWLSQAQLMNLTDVRSQRGIIFLQQLLAALTPKKTVLLANYPNPFNPETWIPYHLSKDAEVTLQIYAMDGTLMRRFTLGHQPAGMYQSRSRAAYWDGRNAFGEPVASGVYFYTLTAGNFTATRKMLIRK